MLWIALAAMTGAAVLCVVWPLSKPRTGAALPAGDDVPFYRDQLRLLDREIETGVVPADEAAGSRAELGRRLLAAHDRATQPVQTQQSRARLLAMTVAVMLVVPAISLGIYLRIGQPEQGDMPLASRDTPAAGGALAQAMTKVESHLAANPGDGRGFEVLAPLYLRMGRADDAVRAYERALALLGESPARRLGYAQALMAAGDGVVTADARRAFEQASRDDPASPEPKFYLGVAAAQDGDKAKARTIWTDLAASAPQGAPWLPIVKARLAALDGAAPPPVTGGGPDSAAGAAVAALPPEQRTAMIHSMVDGLAARLAQNGNDKDGWLRLVRAYVVLGEKDRAATALADGRRNLASDPQALTELDGLAHELGLES